MGKELVKREVGKGGWEGAGGSWESVNERLQLQDQTTRGDAGVALNTQKINIDSGIADNKAGPARPAKIRGTSSSNHKPVKNSATAVSTQGVGLPVEPGRMMKTKWAPTSGISNDFQTQELRRISLAFKTASGTENSEITATTARLLVKSSVKKATKSATLVITEEAAVKSITDTVSLNWQLAIILKTTLKREAV